VALGAMAERARVPHVVLTHLIPPPDQPADADAFAQDLRDGGYRGTVTVGEDLTTVSIGGAV
jgi:ribonuclease Z